MVGFERVVYFLTDEALTVYILGYHTVRSLHQKHTEFGIGAVGIGGILVRAKVADPYVFSVVSVGVTSRRNESVGRVIGAGKGSVREHIAVEVIAHGVAVERDQTVVGVILEAAIGCRGYVTCCIVVEGLGRDHRVITELLDSPCCNSAEIIISITHFGRICMCLDEKQPHPKVRLKNHRQV